MSVGVIYLKIKRFIWGSGLLTVLVFHSSSHSQKIINIAPDDFEQTEKTAVYTQFNYPIENQSKNFSLKTQNSKTYYRSSAKNLKLSELDIKIELSDKTVRTSQPNSIMIYAYANKQKLIHSDQTNTLEQKPVPDELFMQVANLKRVHVHDVIEKLAVHLSVYPLGDYSGTPNSKDFPKKKSIKINKLDDGRYVASIDTKVPGYYVVSAMVNGKLGSKASSQTFYRQTEQAFKVVDFPISHDMRISKTSIENNRLQMQFDFSTQESFIELTDKTAHISGELWASGGDKPAIQFSGMSSPMVTDDIVSYHQSIALQWFKKLKLNGPYEVKNLVVTLPGYYYLSLKSTESFSLTLPVNMRSVINSVKFDGIETQDMLLGATDLQASSGQQAEQNYDLFYIPDFCSDTFGDDLIKQYDDKTVFLSLNEVPLVERKKASISQYSRVIHQFLKRYSKPLTKHHQFASVIAHGIGGLAAFEAMVHFRHSPLLYSDSSYVKYSLQTIGTPWHGSQLIDYYQLMTDEKRMQLANQRLDFALEQAKLQHQAKELEALYELAKSEIKEKIAKPLDSCQMNPYLKPDVVARWHNVLMKSQQVYRLAMSKIATHGSYGVKSFLHDGCDWVQSILLSESQHSPNKFAGLDDLFSNTFDTLVSGAAHKRVWKGACYKSSTMSYPNQQPISFDKQTLHKELIQWLFDHASRQPRAF